MSAAAIASAAFAPAVWDLRCANTVESPAAAIGEDARILGEVAHGHSRAIARIWQSDSCIAVPARLARSAAFPAAARRSAAAGWPVVIRGSGGEPVPLAPGVVNLSLAYWVPHARRWSIEDAYAHLASVVAGAVRSLGFPAAVGVVAHAFCAGRFDLGIDGRKIAGTAQHRRPARRADAAGTAILAHLALFVDPDLEAALAALGRFEALLGTEPAWRKDRVTSLARCRRGAASPIVPSVVERLRVNLKSAPMIGPS